MKSKLPGLAAGFILCAILGPTPAGAEKKLIDRNQLAPHWKAALEARSKKDYDAAIRHLEEALKIAPRDAVTINGLAALNVRKGDLPQAVAWLEKLADRGLGFDPEANPVFTPLRERSEYQALLRKFAEHEPKVSLSQPMYTIREPDLIPEGIAWDPVDKVLYVSSMYKHKVVRVDSRGRVRDFTTPGQDGLLEVVGMKVNAELRHLWVASGDVPDTPAAPAATFLHQYDLRTGKLLRKYALPPAEQHFLNDLDLSPAGEVFVSDSPTGAIYRLRPGAEKLEIFVPAGTFEFPNGAALAGDGKTLYVATYLGLAAVDVARGTSVYLSHPEDAVTTGIDGLYWDKGELLAVQNGLGKGRVMRFHLGPSGREVMHAEIIESGNPLFNVPTTLAIAGDDIYYMANTQLDALGPDGKLDPNRKLSDVLILMVRSFGCAAIPARAQGSLRGDCFAVTY
ncbi:MAG: SMP-30/gluconolactonase/LRE family protein [Terriglobales bacterium]